MFILAVDSSSTTQLLAPTLFIQGIKFHNMATKLLTRNHILAVGCHTCSCRTWPRPCLHRGKVGPDSTQDIREGWTMTAGTWRGMTRDTVHSPATHHLQSFRIPASSINIHHHHHHDLEHHHQTLIITITITTTTTIFTITVAISTEDSYSTTYNTGQRCWTE